MSIANMHKGETRTVLRFTQKDSAMSYIQAIGLRKNVSVTVLEENYGGFVLNFNEIKIGLDYQTCANIIVR